MNPFRAPPHSRRTAVAELAGLCLGILVALALAVLA